MCESDRVHVGRPLEPATEAALRYLVAVGEATEAQLEAAAHQATRPAIMRGFSLSGFSGRAYVGGDLRALGLAERSDDGLRATAKAERFLEHLDRDQRRLLEAGAQEPGVAIVGVPSEPIVYASILTELLNLDDVLFVDPFLAADDLGVLQRLGTVTRALTGYRPVHDRGEKKGQRRTLLEIAAGRSPDLAVRLSHEIHDRYAIPRSGAGLMLGASLGSAKVTTIIELSAEVTATLRTHLESFWTNAEKVEPISAPGSAATA